MLDREGGKGQAGISWCVCVYVCVQCGLFPILYTPSRLAYSKGPSLGNVANMAFLAMVHAGSFFFHTRTHTYTHTHTQAHTDACSVCPAHWQSNHNTYVYSLQLQCA